MITLHSKGNYSKALNYLASIKKPIKDFCLEKYAREGVIALMNATPVDSGKTRDSWYYKIIEKDNVKAIQFCNSNINKYVSIAIILQYGHRTGNGAWVEGRDYINPAIQPIFDKIAEDAWKEVTRE